SRAGAPRDPLRLAARARRAPGRPADGPVRDGADPPRAPSGDRLRVAQPRRPRAPPARPRRRRRGGVPRRAEGGCDRRGRRGGGEPATAARAGAQRGGRTRSRGRAPRARGAGGRSTRQSPAMTERRRADPLPLGGDGLPYSKGLMARALISAGVPAERAYELAVRVESDLILRGETQVELDRLEELAQAVLGENEGSQALRRLRRYETLRELDLPIILLVGGATGTGKSTVATEVAYRLGITRVSSTDFVRQTMRAFLSRRFMPSIHRSSFEVPEDDDLGDVLGAFVEQTQNVLIGVRAVIDRALQE